MKSITSIAIRFSTFLPNVIPIISFAVPGVKISKLDINTIKDKKKVYFLPDLKSGDYTYIKTDTLKFLVNTSTSNVIKIYAFLKKKQEQHRDLKYDTPYRFSQAKLLEVIGYNGYNNNGSNLKMVKDILVSLQNNGLIKTHKEWINTGNDNAAEYFVLDAVNEDYIHSIPSNNRPDNSYVAVPCPYEELKLKNRTEVLQYLGF